MFNSDEKDKQPEFFGDLDKMPKKPKRKKLNLGKIALSLSYENLIVFFIGLIMLLIVCFSLGVERGKYLFQVKGQDAASEDIQIEDILQESIEPAPAAISIPTTTTPVMEPKKEKKKRTRKKFVQYTIQVATFGNTESVKKEITRLEEEGYQPFVINRAGTKGTLSEICVGNYETKNEATDDLKKLRRMYNDCFIRRFAQTQ